MGAQPAGDDRAAGKPKRETWEDWQDRGAPEPRRLLTQAELLALLAGYAVIQPPVTKDDLRYWQGRRILPAPVRRWHDGATRALYPPWYATLVADLRLLTYNSAFRLAEMAAILRPAARQLSLQAEPEPTVFPFTGWPTGYEGLPPLPRSPFYDYLPFLPPPPPPELAEWVTEAVAWLALPHSYYGLGITHATITLFDTTGRAIRYPPIPLNLPAFDPRAYAAPAPDPPPSEEGTPE